MTPKSMLVAVLAAAGVAVASPAASSAQIVGGDEASEGDFPFMVAIHKSGYLHCGGSLLNKNTVLAAAQCSYDYMDGVEWKVTAGSLQWATGGKTVDVDSITLHPDFDAHTLDKDVAIWKLAEDIAEEGESIAYADLPAAGSDPAVNSTVTGAGWGLTSWSGSVSADLLKVSLHVIAREDCGIKYWPTEHEITENMICAGIDADKHSHEICEHDAGGPLVNEQNQLVGIASYDKGCGAEGDPGAYTRVSTVMDFIQQYI